jgi:heme exporter protein A
MDALKNALTVTENLAFWRDYYGPTGLDLDDALEAVRLDHIAHLPAGWLSAGQRRRLGLGRLLVSHRPVWLLDEPTSALDALSEERLIGLINAHLDGGGLAVIATHQPVALARRQDLRIGARPEIAA